MIPLFYFIQTSSAYWVRNIDGEESFKKHIYQEIPWVTVVTTKALQNIYKVWPKWERERRMYDKNGKLKDEVSRRKEIFDRYGLIEAPYNNQGFPMGFTPIRKRAAQFNCLLCHSSSLENKVVIGLGNTNLDLDTFFEDLQTYKSRSRKTPDRIYNFYKKYLGGSYLKYEQGLPKGTTNAMAQSAFVLSLRNKKMGRRLSPNIFEGLEAHASDIPAYWTTAKKKWLFHDGFAEKNSRSIMLFTLADLGGKRQIYKKHKYVEAMLKYINNIRAPKIQSHFVNYELARQGKSIFNRTCARCHGTENAYKQKIIPYSIVKTDPVRLTSGLTPEFRQYFGESWLGYYGKANTVVEPKGYSAPPLNGIWATAPYLHNGSVPTLYDLLTDESKRPKRWRRIGGGELDYKKMGVKAQILRRSPLRNDIRSKRNFYDTSKRSLSNLGHSGRLFGTTLSEADKQSLIEYLKTL